MILVTGGAGFVGSNFVLQWITEEKTPVVNFDKLTSAGNLNNLSHLEHHPSHYFVKGDIRNKSLIHETLRKYNPIAVIHCAAETHIERSVNHPEHFVQTNIVGTFELLEETYSYWKELEPEQQKRFRFLHVSSDEVYGLAPKERQFATESSALSPGRLYAASKASADHLVLTYYHKYGMPVLITRCPNNFGPYQFPEKLIPLTIVNALQGKELPIYGDGSSSRTWLFVKDHCMALRLVLNRGIPGEIYNIGEQHILTNRALVEMICQNLDEFSNDPSGKPYTSLIKFVKDKPDFDIRYTLDHSKLKAFGWAPAESFESSLRKTIQWYLHNMPWVENIVSGEYRDWIHADYAPSLKN